jgi:hypothetical protein
MTAPTREDLATFAAVLEEFAAAERARALTETRKQRISVARHVGDQNIAFEIVVDEGSSAAEIFDLMAPIDSAIDRLKAKADLSDHYREILNLTGRIEVSINKIAAERAEYEKANAKRNLQRREPITYTDAQLRNIEASQSAIRENFEKIAEQRKCVAECLRILAGENPFEVLDEQITTRLDRLRGVRQDAA